MSLLTICTNALSEISGFDVPSTFYGNTNLTAKLCVALANREGKTLEKEIRWAELVTEHTFTTVSGTADYSMPSGFRAFANLSQWDRTNQWRLTGPIPSLVWQWLKSGITVAATNNRWFAMRGPYISIYPTPTTTGDTISFDYYSSKWITRQVDGVNVTEWSADNDTARINEDLIAMGVKWRFLQAKGMPYEPEYKEYEAIKEALKEENGGHDVINLGRQYNPSFDGNIPDTGYGS